MIKIIKITNEYDYSLNGNIMILFKLDTLQDMQYKLPTNIPLKLISILLVLLENGVSLRDIHSFFEKKYFKIINRIISDLFNMNFLNFKYINISKSPEGSYNFTIPSNSKNINIPNHVENLIYIYGKSPLILNVIVKKIVFKNLVVIIPIKNKFIIFKLTQNNDVCLNCMLLWVFGRMSFPYDFILSVIRNNSKFSQLNIDIEEITSNKRNHIFYSEQKGKCIYSQSTNLKHPKCDKKH